MLFIERVNMVYNESTDFGQNPNGFESEMDKLLAEWDILKVERQHIKNGIA